MKNLFKTLLVLLTITAVFLNTSEVKAISNGDTYYIWKNGYVDQTPHIKNSSNGKNIVSSYVGFTDNNTFFPAYCDNVSVPGVGGSKYAGYNVTVNGMASDTVWRVISNGYPYKTPAELGVETEYDAFVATKHAVYVVLGQAPISRYKAKDARGTKIVNAMKNLVNKSVGPTGKASYQAPNFNVTEKSITTDGTYAVMVLTGSSSTVPVNQLTVSLSGNVPAGTKITDINGTAKTTFKNNEQIKISVPLSSISKTANFNIKLNANFATYRVYFGASSIKNTQNYYLTTDRYEYASATKTFNYTKPEEPKRTCDDIIKEYNKCSKNDSCSNDLIKEYEACVPKRTCDDVIKEYEKCSKDNSCSKDLIKEYEACVPEKTCDDVIKEYEKCSKDDSCSKDLIKEYEACVKERTCDDVIKEYNKCSKDNSCSEDLTKEYKACVKERTCDDVIKEYNKCSKDNSCSEDLTKEYKACVKERTCDDVIKEYNKCSKDNTCSEDLTKEYQACIEDLTCDEVFEEYNKCFKDNSCSEELLKQYQVCTPNEEEINPNTGSLNLLLAGFMLIGASGTSIYAYRKRKMYQ